MLRGLGLLLTVAVLGASASVPDLERFHGLFTGGPGGRPALTDDQCPQPDVCPAGYTGHYCDIILCDAKGYVPQPAPEYGYPIDIVIYNDTCAGTLQLPVDSSVDTLYVMVDSRDSGGMPSFTLTNASGAVVPISSVHVNDSKTLVVVYDNPPAGKYIASLAAGLPCVYQAHALTDLAIGIGFTYGYRAVNNDNPAPKIPENIHSYAVVHPFSFTQPGYINKLELWEGATLKHGYDPRERYRCAYEYLFGPFYCSEDLTYYFKVRGVDKNGFDFQRTNLIDCTSDVTTTTPWVSTTSSGACEHGGQLDPVTGNCVCPPEWVGPTCHDIVCFNGGTPTSDNFCACFPNYIGEHCELPMCTVQNPLPPFSPIHRSLGIAIQYTGDMQTEINALKKYVSEILDDFEQYHPDFITQYTFHTFDDTNVKTWYVGPDPFALIEYVIHLPDATNSTQNCYKQAVAAVGEAVKYSTDYGYVFVITDSPDGSSLNDSTNTLDLIEERKTQVNFWVTGSRCGNRSDYDTYREVAEFSGGQSFLFDAKDVVAQMFGYIPAIYQDTWVLADSEPDCTQTRTDYVQVDSHTVAFSVAVHGNKASITITTPDGSKYPTYTLVDDTAVQVMEVITLCPEGFVQYGHDCYLGNVNPSTWEDAHVYCHKHDATLVTILNSDEQAFFDQVAVGRDYWSGLNDYKIEGRFVWDSLGDPLPLGHYYLNWADGEPDDANHTQNCVAVKHNGDANNGQWYDESCDDKFAFICQRHAFDQDNNRLPPGNWKVEYTVQDGGETGKTCNMNAHAQSDLQVYYGFARSQFNDIPTDEPLQSISNNYLIANVTNLASRGAAFDSTQFWSPDHILLGAEDMQVRANCSFDHVSQPFACPAPYFNMRMIGHDEQGFTWQRLRNALCIASAGPPPEICFVDLVVVVDSSESVSYQEFQRTIQFLSQLTEALVIDPDSSVELGGVVFNDQIVDQWSLDEYTTSAAIIEHLDNIRQSAGLTDTALGLQTALTILQDGARPNANQMVILFSDGWHNTGGDPVTVADQLREAGADVLSIGIDGVNGYLYPQHYTELLAIAGGDKNMVLNVTGISGFANLLPQVLSRLDCPAITTPTPTTSTTTHPPYQCYGDVTFVVGTTERVGPLVQSLMQMVVNMSSIIGMNDTGASHAALVHYSSPDDRTGVSFDFTTINTQAEINNYIQTTDWDQYLGISDVDLGLRDAITMFTAQHGDRNDAPNYTILISDGFYDNDTNCCPEPFTSASQLRQVSSVWALSVGPDPQLANLQNITGSPDRIFAERYNADLAAQIVADILSECGAATTPNPALVQ